MSSHQTIRDVSGVVVVEFSDSRIALYNGKQAIAVAQQSTDEKDGADAANNAANPLELYLERQPTLRVQWKPDVLRLSPQSGPAISRYLDGFVAEQPADLRDDESLAVIGGLLGLAGHKNPRMRVLEIDSGDAQGYKSRMWQAMLGKQTAFARVRSWHVAALNHETGEVSVTDNDDGEQPFEVLLLPRVSPSLITNTRLLISLTCEIARHCVRGVTLDSFWRQQDCLPSVESGNGHHSQVGRCRSGFRAVRVRRVQSSKSGSPRHATGAGHDGITRS